MVSPSEQSLNVFSDSAQIEISIARDAVRGAPSLRVEDLIDTATFVYFATARMAETRVERRFAALVDPTSGSPPGAAVDSR